MRLAISSVCSTVVPSGARIETSNWDSSFFGRKSLPPTMNSGTTETQGGHAGEHDDPAVGHRPAEDAARTRARSGAKNRRLPGACRFACLSNESQRLAIIGVSVKATRSETRIENAMVRPKEFMNRPTMPPMNATGRNTATSDRVVASTASPISRVPSSAACIGGSPFSSISR